MNGEFSDFFLTQTMPQSNITVICSKFGEYPQRLFCLSLDYKEFIKLEIPSQKRKNFTPMWSHVFFFLKKKWDLVTHTTKLNAGSRTDSLETESIKVL